MCWAHQLRSPHLSSTTSRLLISTNSDQNVSAFLPGFVSMSQSSAQVAYATTSLMDSPVSNAPTSPRVTFRREGSLADEARDLNRFSAKSHRKEKESCRES